MKVALLIFTDGRERCLKSAIASVQDNLKWNFHTAAIINDEPEFNPIYPGYVTSNVSRRLGYCRNIQRAWDSLTSDVEYIFHLEDDFVFNQPVPLKSMIEVLESHPYLAQMALMRQALNVREAHGGTLVKSFPDRFEMKAENGHEWLESNFCFTNNPCVYPVRITRYPYPIRDSWPWGEGEFSALLRDEGYKFAYWDGWEQAPKVTHIG